MADVVISEFMDEPTANELLAEYDAIWDPSCGAAQRVAEGSCLRPRAHRAQ